MKKKSLFKKFTFLVIPLIVLAALAVGLGIGLISKRAFERNIKADYSLAAALASRQIEFFLQHAFQETDAAAAFISAIRLDKWRTQMAMSELRHKFPHFQYLALLDLQGIEQVNSRFNSDMHNQFARTTFQQACQGKPAHSRIVIQDRIPVIFIAAPVFRDGRQEAVVWGRLNAKPIWDVVIQLKRDLNFGADGHVFLMDQDRTLIASDEISKQFGQVLNLETPPSVSSPAPINIQEMRINKSFDTYDPETLKSLLKDWQSHPEFWVGRYENRNHIFVKSDIAGVQWALYMVQPYGEAFKFLNQAIWAGLGLVVLVILAGIILTRLMARRFVSPITQLRRGVDRAARGDLSSPIHVDSSDEVEELAERFNDMQMALRQYIDLLMEKTEELNHSKCLAVLGTTASNVNHQVGNFLNNLALALSIIKSDQLSDASKDSLQIIEENTRQIGSFIERLLHFSKRADLTLTPWEPNVTLHKLIKLYHSEAEARQISLELIPQNPPPVLADHVLLEEALKNLLSNAIDATPAGGRIVVRTAGETERVRVGHSGFWLRNSSG